MTVQLPPSPVAPELDDTTVESPSALTEVSASADAPLPEGGASRRRFLQSGAALGVSLAALPAGALAAALPGASPAVQAYDRIRPAFGIGQPSGAQFMAQRIAEFALRVGPGDLTPAVRQRLKLNLLDTLGCAVGALGAEPIQRIRKLNAELGGEGQVSLIGGGRTAVDRAALYHSALVRNLDFMDNFASPGEVTHPADCIGGILTVADYAKASGLDFLVAMAVGYQVQCRLTEVVPTIRAGLQNSVPQAFAVGAASAKLLGLDAPTAASAVALSGINSLALAAIQAEPVSQWKGLSTADSAMRAVHNTFLARAGITGPLGLFEGPYGLGHLVGHIGPVDWAREKLDMIERTSIKAVNGEYQSQTAVTTALQLRREHNLTGAEIERVRVDVPLDAYEVIGGGSYGHKDAPRLREQADHNLLYMIAAALLDGTLEPAQYARERIVAADVQALLRRVSIQPDPALSIRSPEELPARVTLLLRGGRQVSKENADYEGFYRRPMPLAKVTDKFRRLTAPFAGQGLQDDLIGAVNEIETIKVRDLMKLLGKARTP